METKPLIVERTYNASIERVWKAITDKDQMKEWHFEIDEFKAEKGFKFSFTGGDENVQFTHHCEVLEADPPNKLSYTWTYPDYKGYSVVTFELFKEGDKKTRVRLSHSGLESFPQDNENFGISSFTEGWNSILGDSLKNYVETEIISLSVDIHSSAETIWNILLNPGDSWGKAFGGGSFVKSDWKPGSSVTWTDLDGGIGAVGIISQIEEGKLIRVDMFDNIDDINNPNAVPGEYSEIYTINTRGVETELIIESGPLAKKYIKDHSAMWEDAVNIIKETAEKK